MKEEGIPMEVLQFFDKMPQALPLYQVLEEKVCACCEGTEIKVQKTQISFRNKYNFAFASLPFRKMKGCPEIYIIVSFGLRYEVKSPRIAQVSEPYPNRWTHHVVIQNTEEIDSELMGWLIEASIFAKHK